MRPAPDTDSPSNRLRALKRRFTQQERFMAQALRDLQEQLEGFIGQTADRQDGTTEELQQATTDLSIDLTHVRMAIAGAAEELASYEDRGICRLTYQRLGA